MTRTALMALAEQERASLLTLLQDLDDGQWACPSLCPGWSVRDVAVHVVSYDELGALGLARTFLAGGLRVASVNEHALRRHAGLDRAAVLDLVARCRRPRGLTAGFGGGIALTDGTIHQQDIRRALSLPREIPRAQLAAVLDFAVRAPTLPGRTNARGISLSADDLDWTRGTGPLVSGPGEALLMAVAGRPDALLELSGDGLPTLRDKIS